MVPGCAGSAARLRARHAFAGVWTSTGRQVRAPSSETKMRPRPAASTAPPVPIAKASITSPPGMVAVQVDPPSSLRRTCEPVRA